MTIAQLLTQFILPYNARAVPVAEDGRLVGIVTLGDIKDVAQEEWGMVTVGQRMTGPDKLKVVHPQDDLQRALELINEGDFDQVPVVDATGRLVGLLTRAHVLQWLQIRDQLKMQQQAPGPGRGTAPGT
jgi:CBS domain-containing protein